MRGGGGRGGWGESRKGTLQGSARRDQVATYSPIVPLVTVVSVFLRTPSSYRALEAGTESVEFSYGDWQSAHLKALGAGASFNCGLAHLLGILQGHQLPTLCPNEYPIRSPALLEIGIEGLPMSYSTSRYIEIEYPGACYCFWSSWDCIRRHRLGTVNTPTSVAL